MSDPHFYSVIAVHVGDIVHEIAQFLLSASFVLILRFARAKYIWLFILQI